MIAGDLEYVLASLPHLSFEDGPELRSKVSSILKKYASPSVGNKNLVTILEDEADKFLDAHTSRLFREISLHKIHSIHFQESKNKLLGAFSKYVHDLKQQLIPLRMVRRNKEKLSDAEKQQLPIDLGSPLEEELQFMKLQWNKLETLTIGHHTDFTALIGYKLKLMLLLRWWSFDTERGFELFVQASKED